MEVATSKLAENETISSSSHLLSNSSSPKTSYSPKLSRDDEQASKNEIHKDENNDEDEGKNLHGTTPLQTIFAIFKGNVGPGCLSLPWAFSILGIPLGCVTTIIVTFLVSYNAWTLVRLKRKYLGGRRGVTYSDVGERAYGERFRIVVDLSVILLQLAVCTVFISNMAENTSTMIRRSFFQHNDEYEESSSWFSWHFMQNERVIMTLFLLPACMLLSSLPNLKVLAPSIALASFLMIASFFLIGYIIYHDWSNGYAVWLQMGGINVQWNKVPLATCAIMYSLEGDQLILPIEAAMTYPKKHFVKTFVASMTGICVLFCVFASACVIAFGYVDDGSITAFLLDRTNNNGGEEVVVGGNESGWDYAYQIAFLANAVVSISLLFTYPLQLFPALGLVGQIIARRQRKQKKQRKELLARSEQQQQSNEDKNDASSKNTSFQSLCEDDASSTYHDAFMDHDEEYDVDKKEQGLENGGGIEFVSLQQLDKKHQQNDDNCVNENDFSDKKWRNDVENQNMKSNLQQSKPHLSTDEDFFQEGLDIEGDSLFMRFSLVFVTYLSAMIVPQLRLLIALGGAITGSMTSLIVPPLLALRFVWKKKEHQKDCCWWSAVWYIGLISVGFVYAYIGTAASIKDIVDVYRGKEIS